ncbi:MAG: hypothetical protein JO157_18020 [Acetobacteraceae bacterium]|nr:hypothetical protein [Acetobacteraceae bacterium]
MPLDSAFDAAPLQAFTDMFGAAQWQERLAGLRSAAAAATWGGRQVLQRHCIEFVIDRLRAGAAGRRLSQAEQRIAALAEEAVSLHERLSAPGKARLAALMQACLADQACLVPLFHLLRTARLQRSRGFEVAFAGLEDQAPFDLLIARASVEAEVACDVVSAEEGRGVHRGAWFRLVDRIDPELQTWLRAHPGRYLLKLTFPIGLKTADSEEDGLLGALHARISQMLAEQRRADGDAAAVLRLDPLMLAAAQADELGLMPRLRREFGPEAHLAVTTAGGGVFAMAARAGQQNEIAAAVRRRMAAIVAARLTGTRPGILAMFIEDTDKTEWRLLRDRLELEGEARQFLTFPEARSVVAVSCASRLELFGLPEPDSAPEGELRFRNPAHPAAKAPALAPAVLSSV